MIINAHTSNPALVPAIIGAIGAVISAVLLALAALRAQRRHELIEQINELLRRYADESFDDLKEELHRILDARTRGLYIAEIVKRAVREVFRERDHDRWKHDDDEGGDSR